MPKKERDREKLKSGEPGNMQEIYAARLPAVYIILEHALYWYIVYTYIYIESQRE